MVELMYFHSHTRLVLALHCVVKETALMTRSDMKNCEVMEWILPASSAALSSAALSASLKVAAKTSLKHEWL